MPLTEQGHAASPHRATHPVRPVAELERQKLISLGPQIVPRISKATDFSRHQSTASRYTETSKNGQCKHLPRSSESCQQVPETNFQTDYASSILVARSDSRADCIGRALTVPTCSSHVCTASRRQFRAALFRRGTLYQVPTSRRVHMDWRAVPVAVKVS